MQNRYSLYHFRYNNKPYQPVRKSHKYSSNCHYIDKTTPCLIFLIDQINHLEMMHMYCLALIFMKMNIKPCIYLHLSRFTCCRLRSLSRLCSTNSLRDMPSMVIFENTHLSLRSLGKIQLYTNNRFLRYLKSFAAIQNKLDIN